MSIDSSKWNERSASSTIKRDGGRKGEEDRKKRRKIAFSLSDFRKTWGEIKPSLCRVCNELLLIKQLFSTCYSSGCSLLRERRGFLAQITNRRISFSSFEKCCQRGVLASLEGTSNVSERKRRSEGETDGWVSFYFCGEQSEKIELLRVTCHTLDELHLK